MPCLICWRIEQDSKGVINSDWGRKGISSHRWKVSMAAVVLAGSRKHMRAAHTHTHWTEFLTHILTHPVTHTQKVSVLWKASSILLHAPREDTFITHDFLHMNFTWSWYKRTVILNQQHTHQAIVLHWSTILDFIKTSLQLYYRRELC